MTRLKSRLTTFQWGLVGLVIAAIVAYLVFGGRAGLAKQPFELKAAFTSEGELVLASPVRIAGVPVGKVTKVEPMGGGSNAALVTMTIDDTGLPLHTDAKAKIRTRLLLEGNFYVDLSPGSPDAPVMKDGGTIPVDRTAGPVQLDRILTDLNADTRINLRTVLQGFGNALGGEPGGAAPGEDPDTVSETAGESVNDSLEDFPQALLGIAQTNDALLGITPDDLTNVIRGQAGIAEGFAASEDQLADLITGFNTTLGAFADRQDDLRATLVKLPDVLEHSQTAFTALDSAFPSTRAFARELRPSLEELPATIEAAGPWIAENRRLLTPSELGGLVAAAQPAVQNTALSTSATKGTFDELDDFNRCLLNSLLPIAETAIEDPPLSTGVPSYLEFFQTFTGFASNFQNLDGNGIYGRAQTGGGTVPIETNDFFNQGPLRGNTTREPLGTRPKFPDKLPPFQTETPCYTQDKPDVNGAQTGAGP